MRPDDFTFGDLEKPQSEPIISNGRWRPPINEELYELWRKNYYKNSNGIGKPIRNLERVRVEKLVLQYGVLGLETALKILIREKGLNWTQKLHTAIKYYSSSEILQKIKEGDEHQSLDELYSFRARNCRT